MSINNVNKKKQKKSKKIKYNYSSLMRDLGVEVQIPPVTASVVTQSFMKLLSKKLKEENIDRIRIPKAGYLSKDEYGRIYIGL